MTEKSPQRIPIPDLKKKLESTKKPVVIDVREPKEIAASGTIPGALQIRMPEVEKRMAEFPKSADLVFY